MDPELLLLLRELAEVSLSSEASGVAGDPQLDECITLARMIVAREPKRPASVPMTEGEVAHLLFGAPSPSHFDPGEPIDQ